MDILLTWPSFWPPPLGWAKRNRWENLVENNVGGYHICNHCSVHSVYPHSWKQQEGKWYESKMTPLKIEYFHKYTLVMYMCIIYSFSSYSLGPPWLYPQIPSVSLRGQNNWHSNPSLAKMTSLQNTQMMVQNTIKCENHAYHVGLGVYSKRGFNTLHFSCLMLLQGHSLTWTKPLLTFSKWKWFTFFISLAVFLYIEK